MWNLYQVTSGDTANANSECTHNWVQIPKASPEDGDTFRCSKCGITQQKLPPDEVENPTISEKESNKSKE